jgi:hypothetical protein
MWSFNELFKRFATTVRHLFRAVWLFFPAIVFMALTLICFWNLAQGKDLMVLATEHRGFFILFQGVLGFMVLVSWYAARTVANAKKNNPYTPPGYLEDAYYKHMPRFIGFTLFTIVMLAFLQTPLFGDVINTNSSWFYVLLVASIPYYFLLNRYFERHYKVFTFNKLFWSTMLIILAGSTLITLNIRTYSWLV